MIDINGLLTTEAGVLTYTAAAGGTNFWNPIGWALLSVAVAGVIIWAGYSIYQNKERQPKSSSLPSYNKVKLNINHIM